MTEITVFVAKTIRTMEPSQPEATAIAVREGIILEVGSLETIQPWLSNNPHHIDRTFENLVLMPGFIDPHLHPVMAAYILQADFITAMEWDLPGERVAPIRDREGFLRRLTKLHNDKSDPEEPLFAYGIHRNWHGEIWREDLNTVSATRPIVLIHRSFHETIMNDAALDHFQIDRTALRGTHQVDIDRGHFFEMGQRHVYPKLYAYLFAPHRMENAVSRVRKVLHLGGHTTFGDMAFGMNDTTLEWEILRQTVDGDGTAFRAALIPVGLPIANEPNSVETLDALRERSTDRLRVGNRVKLFTDGAFFSQLMQLGGAGYIDGHDGEWVTPPETFEQLARTYWNAGRHIHVHCTGDLGVELALDVLEKLQFERPRFDHRFTIEHFGISTASQARRIADLGAIVSANPYYLYELGEIYSREGVGYERASQMVRLGSLKRNEVLFALHSDFTMAPARPLQNAWIAVNRRNASGDVMCPGECVSVDDALRAITINAAYVLGLEREIGSLCSGKKADFTVLEQDPYTIPAIDLKDIPIWGTVFEGRPFRIRK